MYINNTEATNLKKVFKTCDLTPREAGNLAKFYQHLELHKGIYFLVDYMKDLKSCITRGRFDHKFKGQSKIVLVLSQKGRRGRRMALRILSQYGRWKAAEPRREDYQKFRDAVAQVPQGVRKNMLQFSKEQESRLLLASKLSRYNYTPLNSLTAHVISGNKISKGPPDLYQELISLGDAGLLTVQYEGLLKRVFHLSTEFIDDLRVRTLVAESTNSSYVGRVVGLTKDRGLKVRFIANLMKTWQVMISPLVEPFKNFLQGEEMSAMNDQLGAVDWMVSELNTGKLITSVDLCKATDNLPLYLFEELLNSFIKKYRVLLDPNFLDAYRVDMSLCRSSFYTPFVGVDIKYERGQAMGRWSSKYQLDITMILLAQFCGASGSCSRVNGDDIFFSDQKVASKFLRLLKRLKIPISSQKTYFSKKFGEFSGVTADRYGSLDIFKASKLDVEEDPLGPLRQFGPRGITLVDPKHRKAIWAIASLPTPYGLKSVRTFSADPYVDFKPNISTTKLEVKQWEESWVEQVFAKNDHKLLMERMDRLIGLSNTQKHSPAFNKIVAEKLNDVFVALARSREMKHVDDSCLQRFNEPSVSRLSVFVDNLNSYRVLTSDGWLLEGLGDEDLNKIAERLLEARVTFSNKPDNKQKPKSKLRWVWRIYKSMRKIFSITFPKIFR